MSCADTERYFYCHAWGQSENRITEGVASSYALLFAAYSDYWEQAVYDIVSVVSCIACAGMAFEQERYGMALLSVSICLSILSVQDLPMWGGADGAIGLFALVGAGICIVITYFYLSLSIIGKRR